MCLSEGLADFDLRWPIGEQNFSEYLVRIR
jgi:hypothetical protein